MTVPETHVATQADRPTDLRVPLGWKTGSAAFLLSLAGLILANLAPLVMTAFESLGFDIIAAGNILTAALLISAVVGLATARLATGAQRRRLAIIGMAVATVGFGAAALVPTSSVVVVAFILGGAGVGAAISTSGASVAAFRNPNRVTATGGIVNRLLVMIVLAALPALGLSQLNVFGTVAIISALGCVLAVWLPEAPAFEGGLEHAEDATSSALSTNPDAASAPSRRAITLAGWTLIIAFPIWGASEDAVWALSSALAANVGLSLETLGLALSIAAGCGILAMLIVMVFGRRMGRAIPLAILLLSGGIVKIAIGLTNDPGLLATLIVIVNLLYAFAFVLVIAAAAGLDAKGRWSSPLVGAYLVGSSFSPLIGAALIEGAGSATFGIVMGAVSFVLLLPMAWAAHVSVRAERAEAVR